MTVLSLRAGRLAVDLAPAGGSIARFAIETVGTIIDLLRPTDSDAKACYPLVPFSNRIANGRLIVDGEEFVLAPNWPGQRHPMHGDGWARPWWVARR